MDEEKKNIIFDAISDLVIDFIYYDRKDDEELPRGVIENCIENEDITIEEIIDFFKKELKRATSTFLYFS